LKSGNATAQHLSEKTPVVAPGPARRYRVGLLCERLYAASMDFHLTVAVLYCFATKEASWCLHIIDPQDCLLINTAFLPLTLPTVKFSEI